MGDRKARLAALAAKAGRSKKLNDDEEAKNGENDEIVTSDKSTKALSFRNYAPADEGLGKSDPGDDAGAEESAAKKPRLDAPNSSSALQDALLQAKQELQSSNGKGKKTVTEESAAPKKINWDLKRDIQDKLNKLEKRTQKAIVEMLKERLEKEAAEQADSDESDID
mmetsp:Transcript_55017/g.159275  ORF Transcript_55017/g.159275 Transcript_55017/m.159275 type:complete len:167 (+) Transcript_55017:108-608(+)|eukprot:CAMPEP_0176077758 /NCGR_PEP_ID=MMETSP0120_2-20121206/38883_1 /TAXON_ID=160619 /ORGANISM="Kryptoperidinium foliaceum, Strain CCMP 1326" /LENGTH=166 /DNA_ID=CAMNT_0017411499 /DNA_START=31 /DNA_END=531 /DNA_ORIENTATION=-